MSEAPRDAHRFVDWLVERNQALRPVLVEHLTDNGELLPHVFFGDVTRYASELAREGERSRYADQRLEALLADLDAAMTPERADDAVENLIWVSFVENAQGRAGDADSELRERLRTYPNLSQALRHYE